MLRNSPSPAVDIWESKQNATLEQAPVLEHGKGLWHLLEADGPPQCIWWGAGGIFLCLPRFVVVPSRSLRGLAAIRNNAFKADFIRRTPRRKAFKAAVKCVWHVVCMRLRGWPYGGVHRHKWRCHVRFRQPKVQSRHVWWENKPTNNIKKKKKI